MIKSEILLKKLQGIQTIKTIMEILRVNRPKAIYYAYVLRKAGYLKTKRLSNKVRIFNISFDNKLKCVTYEEIINKHSTIKIATTSETPLIYGKKPSLEETLVYAIKTKNLRTILAALGLFKKIENWKELYRLAKENHIERQVGALYDLARTIMRTRRMNKLFRNKSLPKPKSEFMYVIPGLKSKDYFNLEERWKIYLPFNIADLEVYR